MSQIFHIKEVIDFAIQRETESYELYEKLENMVENNEIKNVFSDLKKEEKTHKDKYSKMLSTLDQSTIHNASTNEQEYIEYMKYMIEEQRSWSTTPEIVLENIMDIIRYSIDREKDAVLFYSGMLDLVKENDKDLVRKIIREEGSHIVKLFNLKKSYQKKESL